MKFEDWIAAAPRASDACDRITRGWGEISAVIEAARYVQENLLITDPKYKRVADMMQGLGERLAALDSLVGKS